MKKVSIIVALTLVVAGFAACGKEVPLEESITEVSISASNVPSDEKVNSPPANEDDIPVTDGASILHLTEPLMVADAAMYRGSVSEMGEEDGVPFLIVKQAEGTVYGPAAIQVFLYEDTKTNFSLDCLALEDYIELYFSSWLVTDEMEAVDAIVINHLGTAEMRIYNGLVESIHTSEKDPNTGTIVMTPFDGNAPFVFHFDKGGHTNFYMDFDSIKSGIKLSIFHETAVTDSLPPQATAIEVRPYTTLED